MPKWTYQHVDFINAKMELIARYALSEKELKEAIERLRAKKS